LTTKVQGWDLGLNHLGFVQLIDGELDDFWYVTSAAGSAAKSKEHAFRLVIPKSKERQTKSLSRLAILENFIDKTVLQPNMPDYIGIEDYAIRAEQGAHYLGEIGGIARILCWFRGVKLRLHDPISVKMFTAHDGTCQKDSIERAVKVRWGVDFSKYNQPLAKPTKRNPDPTQNRTTSEDLADAFAIAQLVWHEVRLRDGRLMMSELHKKEVQVFNRITKTYPVNLLDRDWIENPEGVSTPHGKPVCEKCGSTKCCGATGTKKPKKSKIKVVKR
jgi:Holliday junction resolvasome RuvABC endonuclease subunit